MEFNGNTIIVLSTISSAVVLTITLLLKIKDRKPQIDTFYRYKHGNIWKILVHNPTKVLEKCNMEFNGEKLVSEHGKNYERIGFGKGAVFNMPKDVSDNDENSVFLKDGRSVVLKRKFADMDTP